MPARRRYSDAQIEAALRTQGGIMSTAAQAWKRRLASGSAARRSLLDQGDLPASLDDRPADMAGWRTDVDVIMYVSVSAIFTLCSGCGVRVFGEATFDQRRPAAVVALAQCRAFAASPAHGRRRGGNACTAEGAQTR